MPSTELIVNIVFFVIMALAGAVFKSVVREHREATRKLDEKFAEWKAEIAVKFAEAKADLAQRFEDANERESKLASVVTGLQGIELKLRIELHDAINVLRNQLLDESRREFSDVRSHHAATASQALMTAGKAVELEGRIGRLQDLRSLLELLQGVLKNQQPHRQDNS